MNKIAIIIPSRLNAQRLPNKPLKLIDNKEMILHVYDAAVRSKAGEVYVATPDKKIIEIIKNAGGNAVRTSDEHETGTDRVYEVFKNNLNNICIINGTKGSIKINEPWLPNNKSLIEVTNKKHFYIKSINSGLSIYANQIEKVSENFINQNNSSNLFDIEKSLINMKIINNWLKE